MVSNKELEYITNKGNIYLKETGNRIKKMVGELNCLLMGPIMKDNTQMENLLEWEDFNGVMENFTRVNGLTVKNMVLEFGKVLKEIHISENGKWVFLMVMEFIYG